VRRRTVAELPGQLINLYPFSAWENREGRPPDWPITRSDLSATDIFFTQYYAGGHGLRSRIASSAKIVSDVFIVPSAHKLVNEECDRFPGWKERRLDIEKSAQYEDFTLDMLEDCDALFCPANAVVDDVAEYGEQYRAKCHVVPYSSSLHTRVEPRTQPRRVLFAGTMTLRKGPQYLKMAADLLRAQGEDFTFVFAGGISDDARRQLEGPGIEVLGHISKERLVNEYERGDVFVLPSIAEGSAGVVLEAMGAGLPVVVTRNAGVDFVDGESGIYVPVRDAGAIAEALVRICSDRSRRDAMSAAAIRRAHYYGHAEWEERFIEALQIVHAKPGAHRP